MLEKLWNTVGRYRAGQVGKKSPYRDAMRDMPNALYPFWKRTAAFEFKGIPQDALFFARAAEGLMCFFACVRASGRPCALPSKAADSVWHAWARMAPAGLDAFCLKHFGKVIPHVEAGDMAVPMEAALANCLVQARALEGIPGPGPQLPRLFTLDRSVKMPTGFGYRAVRGAVGFLHLDGAGRPGGDMRYPSGLGAPQLATAGLATTLAYDANRRRKARRDDGSACGALCGSSSDCDSGSGGDSGSGSDSGGSSCGSSCGGGD